MVSFNHWSDPEPYPFLGRSVLLGHSSAVATRSRRALEEYFTKLSFFLKPSLAQLANPFHQSATLRFISFSPHDNKTITFSKNHNFTCWKMICRWGVDHSFLCASHNYRIPEVPSLLLLLEMGLCLLLPLVSHRGKCYPSSFSHWACLIFWISTWSLLLLMIHLEAKWKFASQF